MSRHSPSRAARSAALGWLVIARTLGSLSQVAGAKDLLQIVERNRSAVEELLRLNLGFARAMIDLDHKLGRIDLRRPTQDAFLIRNLASFAAMLLTELSTLPGTEGLGAREASNRMLEAFAEAYINACKSQLPGLRDMCRLVSDTVAETTGRRRVVLLEFPTGNSIPVRLLEHALTEQQVPFEVLSASLSRNDSKRAGITREALIAERITAASLSTGDVVVYVDEWNTGTNFATLAQFLAKALGPSNSTFVPVALVSSTAKQDARYTSRVEQHDKLSARVITRGSPRIEFPALPTTVADAPPFFWAEHDRLAGYRKIQVFGAMFSSLDAAIERLAADPARRQRAFNIAVEVQEAAEYDPNSDEWKQRRAIDLTKRLATRAAVPVIEFALRHAPKPLLPFLRRHLVGRLPVGLHLVRMMSREFPAMLASYRELRPAIQKIVHESNTEPVDDVYLAIDQLGALVEGIVRGSPAERIIVLAQMLEEHEGGVDPADRYYFKAHTPVLTKLTGDDSVFHEAIMRHLHRALSGS